MRIIWSPANHIGHVTSDVPWEVQELITKVCKSDSLTMTYYFILQSTLDQPGAAQSGCGLTGNNKETKLSLSAYELSIGYIV